MNIKSLFFVFTCLLSLAAQGKEITIAYDGFFDRLKILSKGDYEFATLGFYLVEVETGQPCLIKEGEIKTQTRQQTLHFTARGQLLLPFEKALDKDKAVLIIVPESETSQCQLKLQIEANVENINNFNDATLNQINQELINLYKDLSGFWIGKVFSFLLPQQKGVIVEFNSAPSISNSFYSCKDNQCFIEINESLQGEIFSSQKTDEVKAIKPWLDSQ